jgi:O-antigen/teichoic acid export membrane protein
VSRTRRILGGASLAYVQQAAIMIVGLWLTPFLLHRIGQHDLGLWLVAGQLLGYFALLDLGVVAMLPREVAFVVGQDKGAGAAPIAGVVAQVRRIVRWQMPALVGMCALVLWLLPSDWLALRPSLAIVLVAFIVLYPLRVLPATLQGLQELPYLAKTQLIAWVLGTVVTIALILAGAGLYALVLGWVVGQAVPALAARQRLRRRQPELLSRSAAAADEPMAPYFRRSLWVSVGQIAQVLLAGSDVLLLGRILGPAAVVPYACTGKLVTVFANHPQLLMQAAQPALSELRGAQANGRLSLVASALTQAMLLMSGGLAVVILAVNPSFVTWWVGGTQYGGWWLGLAFVAMMLLRHWNVATVYTLFCFGYERQISLTSLADGIVSVVGGAILVWWLGPIGAPLASLVGVVTVSLPINLRSVAREMKVPLRVFLTALLPMFVRLIPLALFAMLVSRWWGMSSLLGLMALGVPMLLLYAIVMLPLAWKGPAGPYLRMAVLPLLTRRSRALGVQQGAA